MIKSCAIVLAAGEGKRMKSNKPKALSCVLFKPMIDWVLDSVEDSGIEDVCVVVGHLGEALEIHLDGKCEIAYQKERLGTGHAVMQTVDYLERTDAENVLILNGDAPFIDAATIEDSLISKCRDCYLRKDKKPAWIRTYHQRRKRKLPEHSRAKRHQ